jgi:hypothetical protein
MNATIGRVSISQKLFSLLNIVNRTNTVQIIEFTVSEYEDFPELRHQ